MMIWDKWVNTFYISEQMLEDTIHVSVGIYAVSNCNFVKVKDGAVITAIIIIGL